MGPYQGSIAVPHSTQLTKVFPRSLPCDPGAGTPHRPGLATTCRGVAVIMPLTTFPYHHQQQRVSFRERTGNTSRYLESV